MKEEQKYDPAGYEKYMKKARRLVNLDSSSDDDSDHDYETANPLTETKPLPYHVVEKSPDVDILICTPGRLVEHIRKTKGLRSTMSAGWLLTRRINCLRKTTSNGFPW